MSTEAKGIGVLAALFWAVTALAVFSMASGNPTAINGVIGCGAGAVVTSLAAVGLGRQDRTLTTVRRSSTMPLSDRDLKAVARLTTQVKRIADAMTTPVVEHVVADETTPVELRQQIADALEAADYRQDMRRGDLADSIMPIVQAVAADRDRLATELARIRRALDGLAETDQAV
ncbi:hypothetical protein OG987_13280 [Streptomyces sp. NBC_01620]|uniref:hypothetical protein n=1 Tax=Streptomyces sp. NBC_01620 TaxID=2975902 RepID=UPI00386909D7|nr:hypothetical protein OG987_13280 [Streptomyces sp. NBC_01620]